MTGTSITRPLLLFVGGVGLAACGSATSDDAAPTPPPESRETTDSGSVEPGDPEIAPLDEADEVVGSGSGSEPADALVGDACAALDDEYLDEALASVESTFGGALDFQPSIQESPTAFCSWQDAAGGISVQLTFEPTSTSDADDHSGRAYNIDVPPVVEPQDGPGTKAVLLLDTAFVDLGGEPLAYGYFFVLGDLTAFVETVGLDIGAGNLRVLADEVAARLG